MTTEYSLDRVRHSDVLHRAYGNEVVLVDGRNESVLHRVVSEFALGDRIYAVLQTDEQRREENVAIYRVIPASGGGWDLETIEDDDEWENVAELYDEMTFDPDADQ